MKNEPKQNDDPLDRLWSEVINLTPDCSWLKDCIRKKDTRSHPIPEVRKTMEQLLATGASAEDLGRVGRAERYEMCFRVLYSMDDPGLKSGKLAGLHEALADTKPGAKGKAVPEKAFFRSLWEDIHAEDNGESLVEQAKSHASNEPFGDTAPALKRLLDQGASAGDLERLAAWHRYEACRETLRILAECFEEAHETFGLHESILMADPSGKEGRPGSWPLALKPAVKSPANTKVLAADPSEPCFVLRSTDDVDVVPAGRRFVAWSENAPARVHDLDTGEQISVLTATKGFNCVEMLEDGKHLAASLRRSLGILDVASGKKVAEVPWKWPSVLKPAGNELLVGALVEDKDFNVTVSYHLFDARTLANKGKLEFKEAGGELLNCRFAPDHRRLALLVVPPGGSLKMTIWSWPQRQCIGEWYVAQPSFAWAPDGSWIATLAEGGVSVMEATTGKALWATGEMHTKVTASPDGQWLVTSDDGSVISIWNVPARKKVRELKTSETYLGGMGIFPNNERLVACCDRRCLFWNLRRLVGN